MNSDIEIIKNKRHSRCGVCNKDITGKYKIVLKGYEGIYIHLECGLTKYGVWADKYKARVRHIKRYKKWMVLEKLTL